jgi:hypothetical protein
MDLSPKITVFFSMSDGPALRSLVAGRLRSLAADAAEGSQARHPGSGR